jgi:hypothetical protein
MATGIYKGVRGAERKVASGLGILAGKIRKKKGMKWYEREPIVVSRTPEEQKALAKIQKQYVEVKEAK